MSPTFLALQLQTIDWVIIAIFFLIVLGIGVVASRSAGKSTENFFLGGRGMPWWLLGISMVACTFSCDTPNLVTDLVRGGGVVSNWGWWAFLITGMVTVFIYAQLWRRSGLMTDLEFYEMRYSGKGAAFLRGFRSIYLGFFFNCLIMGSVTLAAIKIGAIMLGLQPMQTVVGASVFVVIYASLGGIKGVIWSDFFQYGIAMAGAVYAAIVAVNLPEVGGLSNLLAHPAVAPKLNPLPEFNDWVEWVPLLLIPVAVQWWSVWYPGAEPGGGGYIAQKMLSAKDEKNAVGATLLFNFMHYAVRPWPWILVALASIVIYPELSDIKAKFPAIDPKYLGQDIAYPAMLTFLSPGWLGIVVASLIAAYMSTIGTHLNWGSSYVVNDFYQRFVSPKASQKELVTVGRICTVLLMVCAGTLSLTVLESAGQAFKILLLSGAGTGLIYLLRWFWWRINAWTEIVAMVVATVVAILIVVVVKDDGMTRFLATSSLVKERTLSIEDPALAKMVETQQATFGKEAESLKERSNQAAKVWSTSQKRAKEDPDGVAAALNAYEVAYGAFNAKVGESAVLAILNKEGSRNSEIVAFAQTVQKQHETRKSHKDPSLVNSSIAAIVDGERIVLYDAAISSLVFPTQLIMAVIAVTLAWIITTLVTKPASMETLKSFYRKTQPGGPGWAAVREAAAANGEQLEPEGQTWQMPLQVLCIFLGCFIIYGSLFAIGSFIYGKLALGAILMVIVVVSLIVMFSCIKRLRMN
ncbi:Na+:solute symporter [Haloferula rosea]|uniref:Na+:solute symporter n=1 Tax=Haloferula rosea TaxID=490093 RepID=A0A934RB78_9BACT|nr:sodium:solute symporter family protein [Haloferula rosea]MBK1827438.1 Na+:solute symporter [Haloferula rosea]